MASKIGCTPETLRRWVRQAEYDNAMAETIIGLYKTEEIRPKGPWRSIEDVEFATASWVEWFNNRRLLGPIGDIPPVEYEAVYDQARNAVASAAGVN